jgi:hypothetical protein
MEKSPKHFDYFCNYERTARSSNRQKGKNSANLVTLVTQAHSAIIVT